MFDKMLNTPMLEVLDTAVKIQREYDVDDYSSLTLLTSILKRNDTFITALEIKKDGLADSVLSFWKSNGCRTITAEVFYKMLKCSHSSTDNEYDIGCVERLFIALLQNIYEDKAEYRMSELAPILPVNYFLLEYEKYTKIVDHNTNKTSTKKFPVLSQFAKNLTDIAKLGKIDPVIGRDNELERVIHILSRKQKNNPCLVGEPGVGKTAIIDGLALRIANGRAPMNLLDKHIFSLDVGNLLVGTKYRGDMEARVKNIVTEIETNGNVILFIDEIHTIVNAGSSDSTSLDVSNLLKPALSNGTIQVIGATTFAEYKKRIESEAALARRFQIVSVEEPTIDQSINIIKGLRDSYEKFHCTTLTDDAIVAAVQLSAKYIMTKFLPDKAIDIIDEAMSVAKLSTNITNKTESLISLNSESKPVDAAAMRQLRTEALLNSRNKFLDQYRCAYEKRIIKKEDIEKIIAKHCNIPVKDLSENNIEKLTNLESEMTKVIIGQNEAVSTIANAIRRNHIGIKLHDKPIGSFLFLGTTGVGKSFLARMLAKSLFGDEKALIRIDMSELMEKHSISKLIGSPPGYVGYKESGKLADAVRQKPYSVVLFDEIEKAHPDCLNLLLQILDDGRLTDSQGRVIDFRNTIIIMTSNIGAQFLSSKKSTTSIGFATTENATQDTAKDKVLKQLRESMRPELLNRIDEIIVFNKLTEENIFMIARNMISSLQERLAEHEVIMSCADELISYVAKKGYDPLLGARPLNRFIQRFIGNVVAKYILEHPQDKAIVLKLDSDQAVVEKQTIEA